MEGPVDVEGSSWNHQCHWEALFLRVHLHTHTHTHTHTRLLSSSLNVSDGRCKTLSHTVSRGAVRRGKVRTIIRARGPKGVMRFLSRGTRSQFLARGTVCRGHTEKNPPPLRNAIMISTEGEPRLSTPHPPSPGKRGPEWIFCPGGPETITAPLTVSITFTASISGQMEDDRNGWPQNNTASVDRY